MKRILIAILILLLTTALLGGLVAVYAAWGVNNAQIASVYDGVENSYAPGYGEQAYARRAEEYHALCQWRADHLYHSKFAVVRWITAPRPIMVDMIVALLLFAFEALLIYVAHLIYRAAKYRFIAEVCEDVQREYVFANLELRYIYKRNVIVATLLARADLRRANAAVEHYREAYDQAETLNKRKKAMFKANRANRIRKIRTTQLQVLGS